MNFLQKLMQGRYGNDQLSFSLLLVSIIIMLIANISGIYFIWLISLLPLGVSLLRSLSKNRMKRIEENKKYLLLISPITSWTLKSMQRLKDRKTHQYFRCPSCKSTLRLPKGKGKISINCPKCKHEFIGKT